MTTVSIASVSLEQSRLIEDYAQEQAKEIIFQNRKTVLLSILKLQVSSVWARESTKAKELNQQLSKEQNAVVNYVAELIEKQIKAQIVNIDQTNLASKIKLQAILLVLPRAQEICEQVQKISPAWVNKLVIDTKAGSVV